GLLAGQRRCGGGVFAAWHPVKARAQIRALHDGIRDGGPRDVVAVELFLRAPLDAARLSCGVLLVVSPPFGVVEAMPGLLGALLTGLGTGEAGAGVAVERISDE